MGKEKWERYVLASNVGYALYQLTNGSGAVNPDILHERAANTGDKVMRVTVERIEPPQEQPQWWMFDRDHWRVSPFTTNQASTNGVITVVYGTTADRDAKRDALLDAARAAGKDGE